MEWLCVWGQNYCQRLVVHNEVKSSPYRYVLMETLHTKCEGQCFLLDLWVMLLTGSEGVVGNGNGILLLSTLILSPLILGCKFCQGHLASAVAPSCTLPLGSGRTSSYWAFWMQVVSGVLSLYDRNRPQLVMYSTCRPPSSSHLHGFSQNPVHEAVEQERRQYAALSDSSLHFKVLWCSLCSSYTALCPGVQLCDDVDQLLRN